MPKGWFLSMGAQTCAIKLAMAGTYVGLVPLITSIVGLLLKVAYSYIAYILFISAPTLTPVPIYVGSCYIDLQLDVCKGSIYVMIHTYVRTHTYVHTYI